MSIRPKVVQIEMESRMTGSSAGGERKRELLFTGCRFFTWEKEKSSIDGG